MSIVEIMVRSLQDLLDLAAAAALIVSRHDTLSIQLLLLLMKVNACWRDK